MDLLWSESIPESLNVKDYYKYETLNDDEIRIIELEHGTSMDAVHCRLKRVRIADAIDTYEAISYAWGDPNDTAWITCSDAAIKVTNSLLGALKHLRYADRSRYLWADALCINQIDKPEKNNHVQRIGEVYSSAAKVLIWLGENTLEVGEALMNLRDFLRYPIPLFEWNDAQVQWTSQSSFSFRPDHLSEEAVEWLQYQQTAFAPTMQLMMLPWWRRKWVIQELVRAKHAVLISGRYSIEWASVQDALSKLQTPIGLAKLLTAYIRDVFDGKIGESIADLAEQGLNNAAQLADCVIKNTSEGDRLRLFDLMRLSRDFQCSDARDHLYSLLPIASDINQDRKDLLLVDYSASAATALDDNSLLEG
ncbi:MAG: hypothetical protein MMC23_000410 [Stictis urceolatum]|nr:hypothetical protein [Stictis urceolata]